MNDSGAGAKLSPGARLKSVACEAEVVVVKPPSTTVELSCGGSLMVAEPEGEKAAPAEEASGGTELGKRYVHEPSGLEVLCVKAGRGTLAVGGEPLAKKAPKPLPSSD